MLVTADFMLGTHARSLGRRVTTRAYAPDLSCLLPL